nr:sigma-70 family RNA polymerase sigma factor [Planctomycetota bacterium]
MSPVGGDAAIARNSAALAASNGHAPQVDDDHDLVARARAGERGAFDQLVGRHGDRLFAMLLHLVNGDRDAAAEFTQEAFARAFVNLAQFEGRSSFYTWLYRCARNRALDLLARKRPIATDLEPLGRAADIATPLDQLGASELRAAVRGAMARLPAPAREILLMRDFEGLDYSRIAELLAVPEGTVKSRINRARAALKDALAGKVVAEDLV